MKALTLVFTDEAYAAVRRALSVASMAREPNDPDVSLHLAGKIVQAIEQGDKAIPIRHRRDDAETRAAAEQAALKFGEERTEDITKEEDET